MMFTEVRYKVKAYLRQKKIFRRTKNEKKYISVISIYDNKEYLKKIQNRHEKRAFTFCTEI